MYEKVISFSTGHMINSWGLHLNIWRTSLKKTSLTWLNAGSCLISILFDFLDVPPSNTAPPSLKKKRVVCEIADLPLWNKIDCTYYTRSYFKTLLNQVAEGWIPLNSLRSYCLLWSIALNPPRSSCGYQIHLFYEDSSAHNRLEVIKKIAFAPVSSLSDKRIHQNVN